MKRRSAARKLFDLTNLIADVMITQPKAIEALYASLPAGQLQEIEKRDKLP